MAFLLTRTLRTRPASVTALCRTAQTSKFITVGAPAAPGPAVPQQVKLFFYRMDETHDPGLAVDFDSSPLRGVTPSPPSGVPSPAAVVEPCVPSLTPLAPSRVHHTTCRTR